MNTNRKRTLLFGALLALVLGGAGCHRHQHAPADVAEGQAPDKILYEKSLEDIQNRRYDVARLTLQTLINTYPDSDYLAAAKLAIADSYFTEGTTTALTHAEVEYKDFITFFPNAPEVPLAQYRAALCHFRQLEKPDRDPTHARRAEEELQLLLRNYPTSEYAADSEKKLLQVQEVLAEGEYRVGRFYFIRPSPRAAAGRLARLVDRYPNFSRRDHALWMLGQIFQKEIPGYWLADPERAASYYARLVREHPVSEYAEDAKKELAGLSKPIPEPDPVLLARAQTLETIPMAKEDKPGLLGRLFGLLSSKPDMGEAAARLGPPPLEHSREEPAVFKPLYRPAEEQATVAVQTVEDAPAGTVVQAQAGQPDPNSPPAKSSNDKDNGKDSAARKKSFWRKLIPFI
ncbi:MAG: outer membrane protein assembly factor BamD [Acidobacteria bacterium]|nr:outer membrane protein assembly factor BamD [Acidobacteriota bacterium]